MPMKKKESECECVEIDPEKKELERKAHAFDMMVEKMVPNLTETVFAKTVTRTLKGGRIAYLTKDEYEFLKTMMEGNK